MNIQITSKNYTKVYEKATRFDEVRERGIVDYLNKETGLSAISIPHVVYVVGDDTYSFGGHRGYGTVTE